MPEQPLNHTPSGAEKIKPYSTDAPKTGQVRGMFDSIAPRYDFMNRVMTMGLCAFWRNAALKALTRLGVAPESVLDVATGTGDVAFRLREIFPEARITGIDLSECMLAIARARAARDRISDMRFMQADCLNLIFKDNTFDVVTVAYGVRNFENLAEGYAEMFRVLRPGGYLCVIELSCPTSPLLRKGYDFYTKDLIPVVGGLVSGDSRAYTYLPESIAACPQRDDMKKIMEAAGFRDVGWCSLTMGVVTYYIARKP